jgi:hypothetical protein
MALASPSQTMAGLRRPLRLAARMADESEARAPALVERRVPYGQQAVVQLKEVQEGAFYEWAALDQPQLLLRMAAVYVVFAAIGGWIAGVTYTMPVETLQVALAANMGGCVMLLLFMLRIYSGWSFVSDRLGLEVLDYEESGWADGFTAQKPEEVRARDLFLNEFKVKPVLAKLRPIVGAVAVATVISIAAFKVLGGAPDIAYTPEYLSTLQLDDKAAAEEAKRAAQSGKPSYCFDRYYKAVAGGGMCN